MKQLCRCQCASDGESAEGITEVPVGAEIHISFPDQKLQRGVCLLLGKADVRQIVHRS